RVRTLESEGGGAPDNVSAIYGIARESANLDAHAPAILAFAREHVGAGGALLVCCAGDRADPALARLRSRLWPAGPVVARYHTTDTGITRIALDGRRALKRSSGLRSMVMVARPTAAVLAPDATVVKFDKNAASWNGNPGRPGYKHFRWMR